MRTWLAIAILITPTASVTLLPKDAHAITEAEGRRRLVPFIRIFTNCLSDEIRSRSKLLRQAKDGLWKDAIAAAFDACDAKGVEMLLVHDQIYGRGTGLTFLKGPYLQDLPRALQSRLQPDFDRMDTENRAQSQAAEEKEQREAAALDAKKKLVAEAVSAHENCLVAALADITPYSGEAAPTIVDVALDRCAKFAERRIGISVAAYDMTRDEAKTVIDRKITEMRTKMISAVVTARAEATRRREERESTGPATNEGLPKARPL